MKKNLSILVFLAFITSGMFIACQGPDLFHPSSGSNWKAPYWNNSNKDKDAIAEARAWYNLHRDEVEFIATRTDNYRLFGDMEPNWKQTYTRKTTEFTSIESGLKTSEGIFIVSPDCQEKYKETEDKRYLVTMTRLIILKYTDKRTMIGFFMTISPSAEYLEATKFRPFYNTYAQRDKVYDGYIYYHDMQGNFVNGWKYTKGKITNAIHPQTASILPTRSYREICIPQYEYVCESEEGYVNEEGEVTVEGSCFYQYIGDHCYTVDDGDGDGGSDTGDSGSSGGGGGGGGYQPGGGSQTGGGSGTTTKTMPSYTTLSTKFNEVAKMPSADVYKKVGGNIYYNYQSAPQKYANACALRVSYALNSIAGHEIPFQIEKTISGDVNRDGVKEWYYITVENISNHLNNTYGQSKKVTREQIQGKKGIIKLTDCDWTDATGHIDVWDGSSCLSSDYPVCKTVYFWEI